MNRSARLLVLLAFGLLLLLSVSLAAAQADSPGDLLASPNSDTDIDWQPDDGPPDQDTDGFVTLTLNLADYRSTSDYDESLVDGYYVSYEYIIPGGVQSIGFVDAGAPADSTSDISFRFNNAQLLPSQPSGQSMRFRFRAIPYGGANRQPLGVSRGSVLSNYATVAAATVGTPANPTVNATTSDGATTVTVSWDVVTGATGYQLFVQNNDMDANGVAYHPDPIPISVSGTSVNVTSYLYMPGTSSYTFQVAAVDANGLGAKSDAVNYPAADPDPAPATGASGTELAPPDNTRADVDSALGSPIVTHDENTGLTTVSWNPYTASPLDGYYVIYKHIILGGQGDTQGTGIADAGMATTITLNPRQLSHPDSEGRYRFDVRPYSGNARRPLARSAAGHLGRNADEPYTVPDDFAALDAPQNVMADAKTKMISWDAVEGATGYTLYMRRADMIDPAGDPADKDNYIHPHLIPINVTGTSVDVSMYVVAPTEEGATSNYNFRVFAVGENGIGMTSKGVSMSFSAGDSGSGDKGDSGGGDKGDSGGSSKSDAPPPTPKPPVNTCTQLPSNIRVAPAVGGPQCTQVAGGSIGNPSVLAAGVIDAVDVWSHIPGSGVEVCIQGGGRLTFLDALTSPRAVSSLSAYTVNGFTCAVISGPGTVVLQP